MFEILNKYCHTGHFEFHADENLKNICNAPTDKSGVYIVWTILDGNKQLLYIGRSGKKENKAQRIYPYIFQPIGNFSGIYQKRKSPSIVFQILSDCSCWGTRTRTKNDRTRICSVTITPYPKITTNRPATFECGCKGTFFF